jgi:hypothetical protein
LARQFAAAELKKITHKIAVDVIGVIFVLGEGTVRVNIPDANLPQLPRQDFKVVNEMQPPSVIPSGIAC